MTSVTLVRRIRAQPSIVFEALTTSEGIASWWGPDAGPVLVAEISPRIGGRYRVRFRTHDGTELTLTHARLKNEASRKSHGQGWAGSLDKLDRRIDRILRILRLVVRHRPAREHS